jgi:HD-like signal output (HDOD) protein
LPCPAGRPADELKRKALRSLGDLPPFSVILNRLIASLAGENVSFHQLGDLIEKDTVIAGNLLNLVNSALYARRGTVNSVRHALSLLGIEKVRNAILSMSLARMWRKVAMPAEWSMARFNMHSASVAILSDLLAQRVPVAYPEGAFLAGLLHDVGRLMIALALPAEFARIQQLRASGRSLLGCEMEVLGFTHSLLSAEALAAWNLPRPIRTAVLDHHSPVNSCSGVGWMEREIPLSRVINAVDNYANSTGVTIDPHPDGEVSDPSLIESFGVPNVEEMLAEFRNEYAAMSVLFN